MQIFDWFIDNRIVDIIYTNLMKALYFDVIHLKQNFQDFQNNA